MVNRPADGFEIASINYDIEAFIIPMKQPFDPLGLSIEEAGKLCDRRLVSAYVNADSYLRHSCTGKHDDKLIGHRQIFNDGDCPPYSRYYIF